MEAISRPSSEGLERGPLERLEIDERVDVDLGFRKEPGAAGKPGKSGFPGGDLLRASGAANSIYCVQVHGWQPLSWAEGASLLGKLNSTVIESLVFIILCRFDMTSVIELRILNNRAHFLP